MATIISEKRIIEDNIKKFDDRFKHAPVRFSDKTQTYVTYYHVSNIDSTTDDGFMDIESLVGARSPLRYKKITDFPIYGIESLAMQLQDGDFGLDSGVESDGVILPNTLKPVPNSFFTIDFLEVPAIFRITEVNYDNIRTDNFYSIHFKLEFINEERIRQIESKVVDNCHCILENIGTEDKCIIESETFKKISEIEKMYSSMVDTYLDIFFDKTHNSLICLYGPDTYLYDPFLNYFANKNSIFKIKNSVRTIYLSDQFNDPMMKYKYDRTFYRVMERQEPTLLNRGPYTLFPASQNPNSTFSVYYASNVFATDVVGKTLDFEFTSSMNLLSEDAFKQIRSGEDCGNPYMDLITRHLHKKEIPLDFINLDLERELLSLSLNQEIYTFTPVLLYIIRKAIIDAQ